MATQSSTARDAGLATKPKPHPQTSYQCGAGESLRRVDRPGKTSGVVRALRRSGKVRCRRRPICASAAATASASHATDGEYFQVGGVYREIVPNELLVMSWAWHSTPERESLLTISLKPDGAGTLLTLHHEQFFDEAARDGHEKGWTELLGKLEQFVS